MTLETILIVAPMSLEMRAIRPALNRASRRASALVVGVGPGAGPALARWLRQQPASAVVCVGYAGGLDPSLDAGDLVIGRLAVDECGHEIESEAKLMTSALASLRMGTPHTREGRILTAPEPLLTSAARALAFARTGALAADLESWHLAAAAREAGAPFLVVRAILDGAHSRVPSYLADLGDAGLARRLRTVGAGVLQHPGDAIAIARTARDAWRAGASLRHFVEVFLRVA